MHANKIKEFRPHNNLVSVQEIKNLVVQIQTRGDPLRLAKALVQRYLHIPPPSILRSCTRVLLLVWLMHLVKLPKSFATSSGLSSPAMMMCCYTASGFRTCSGYGTVLRAMALRCGHQLVTAENVWNINLTSSRIVQLHPRIASSIPLVRICHHDAVLYLKAVVVHRL